MPEKHGGALDRAGGPDDRLRLWLRLLSVSTLIEKRLRAMLATHDTTLPRFDVLAQLDRHREGLAMGQLSKALLVSNGNVTPVVQALVREGLVETAPSPTDRRAAIVRLTPAGLDAFRGQADAHHALVDRLLAGLEAGNVAALHALLGAVKASLAAADGEAAVDREAAADGEAATGGERA
jgi:DNA-binding MarR family transcriptional regulator